MQAEGLTVVTSLLKIAGTSLATTLGLILGGSYFGIWVWGKTHRELVAELKTDRDYWKDSCLKMLQAQNKARHVRERLGERP